MVTVGPMERRNVANAVGLGEEEAALLRAVLLPQYDRFAAVWQPAPEPTPAAPTVETGAVMVALSTSTQPISLRVDVDGFGKGLAGAPRPVRLRRGDQVPRIPGKQGLK